MALTRGRRRSNRVDYWPGFVDALSTLLLAIMFLLSVFVLAQFLLSQEISGKDTVLNRLNSQINELTSLLALERSNKQDFEDALSSMQSSLKLAEAERSRLQRMLAEGSGAAGAAQAKADELSGTLDGLVGAFPCFDRNNDSFLNGDGLPDFKIAGSLYEF